MSWRPLGPTNRYASRRRILASLGPKSSSPPQGTFSILPVAPVADAFAKLAQENLNRLKGLNEEALAQRKLASLESSEELKHSKSQKNIKPAVKRNSDDEPTQAEDGRARHLSFTSERRDERAKEKDAARIEREKSISERRDERAKEKDAARIEREKALEKDKALHKDLDYVLDAFRALQDKISQPNSSLIDTSSFTKPAPGLRPSPLGRLANQYYQNKANPDPSNSSRAYSTRSEAPKVQPSTSLSAPSILAVEGSTTLEEDNTSDEPVFLRGNSTIQRSIGGQNIREHLRLWQAHQRNHDHQMPLESRSPLPFGDLSQNPLTQSAEDDSSSVMTREDDIEEDSIPGIDAEDSILSILHAPKFLRQGDLVEHWTLEEPILSIFVKNYERNSLFYTERGSWLTRRPNHTRFSVPNFVDRNTLNDLLPYIPSAESTDQWLDRLQPMMSSAPRDVGRRVLDLMQRFRSSSDSIYRKHAEKLDRAYDIMAPDLHSEGMKSVSLEDAALRIFEKGDVSELSPSMLWTLHRTLSSMQNVSTDWHIHRLNPVFVFIPKQDLMQMNELNQWMREFQERAVEDIIGFQVSNSSPRLPEPRLNPISSFVEKAKKIILASRQSRALSPTGAVGPDMNKSDPSKARRHIWAVEELGSLDAKDQIILSYLNAWVTAQYLNKKSAIRSLGPMILRSVGLYQDYDLDESTGFTLLQELGLISPWQDASLYRTRLGVPGHDTSHPMTVLRNEAFQSHSVLKLHDTMAHYRKDWGETPVFCVDSADTTDRDDGISLEEIEGEDSKVWVHVHVANPSAFIDPQSTIARYAAKTSETIYLPEIKHPMLDPNLTQELFSLGVDRPCITFSAKVDEKGDVIETEISHGIVHNVFYVTPQGLEDELGLGNAARQSITTLLAVGGVQSQARDERADLNPCAMRRISSKESRILCRLRSIAEATRRRRERNGAIPPLNQNVSRNTVQPEIFFGEGVSNLAEPLGNHFRRFTGDPVISLVTNARSGGDVLNMIADLMVLAGEVCARWCVERQIPIPYRGFRINPEPAIDPERFKEAALDPAIPHHAKANESDLLRYLRLLGSIDCSASPLKHIALGLPAYVKATSPLRRYSDLLTHWQIEAAIRHKKHIEQCRLRTDDHSYLPFSHQSVEVASKQLMGRAGQLQIIKNGSIQHWFTMAFFRAFYYNEASLPKTFKVRIDTLDSPVHLARGTLLDWGRSVCLRHDTSVTTHCGGYQIDDIWDVRINKILLYWKVIIMEPIQLISRSA